MEFVKLDLHDKKMMDALYPVYQNYEAELSEDTVEVLFWPEEFEADYEYFEGYFRRWELVTYMCMNAGEVVGFVSFNKVDEENLGYVDYLNYIGWGHIAEIYTVKQMRRTGVGRSMVSKAEEELKKMDIKGIHLADILCNGIFWKSVGYKDAGIFESEQAGKVYEKRV